MYQNHFICRFLCVNIIHVFVISNIPFQYTYLDEH